MLVIEYCDNTCCKPTIKVTDTGKMTMPEKLCYLLEKMGEVIVLVNGYEKRILKTETDIDELYNELYSANAKIVAVDVKVDSNTDQIRFLVDQFEDGATGLVIDGGNFNETEIDKMYDGGVW